MFFAPTVIPKLWIWCSVPKVGRFRDRGAARSPSALSLTVAMCWPLVRLCLPPRPRDSPPIAVSIAFRSQLGLPSTSAASFWHLWQAAPHPSHLFDGLSSRRPFPRRPCSLVRVVAGHEPASFRLSSARLTINSSFPPRMTKTFSWQRSLCSWLTRIEHPSGSVGSIASPATRTIRHCAGFRPSRCSQSAGNLIRPVTRSPWITPPAPAVVSISALATCSAISPLPWQRATRCGREARRSACCSTLTTRSSTTSGTR